MQICSNCVLPSSFPGIRFDERGVCNYCLEQNDKRNKRKEDFQKMKEEYTKKFETILSENRNKNVYDVLVCYSGGKDSTKTLEILVKNYGLNILAVTFDNGFISNQTVQNIKTVTENIGVDHIFFKPQFHILTKIFRHCINNNIYPLKAMERASTICTSCMGIIKYTAFRFALEKNIPFIAFGWSPGQAPITSSTIKSTPEKVKMLQKTIYEPLYRIAGKDIDPYFLDDKHFSSTYSFPYLIHPLAFIDYREEIILRDITHLGWKVPNDTGSNSTNCLLNSFANIVHKQQFGFHPYALDLAVMVREGYLKRVTALKILNQHEDALVVKMVKGKLLVGGDSFGN